MKIVFCPSKPKVNGPFLVKCFPILHSLEIAVGCRLVAALDVSLFDPSSFQEASRKLAIHFDFSLRILVRVILSQPEFAFGTCTLKFPCLN